eukprot:CAMPEP_0184698420 /NCGR_PEP_ID=MMETSP0313-20130426/5056_1 /TAXON_ID=2792 /ORGANISM="Porphyridium aerugineum, Strain SAG 1380-2" /LENGTH=353 /DNA_ID=CAMNT_0027157371 /DNA_START=390 /DNA_END=1451 /DNA_ORIENTATION=+
MSSPFDSIMSDNDTNHNHNPNPNPNLITISLAPSISASSLCSSPDESDDASPSTNISLHDLPHDILAKCVWMASNHTHANSSNIKDMTRLAGVSKSFRHAVTQECYNDVRVLHFNFQSLNKRCSGVRDQVVKIIRQCSKVTDLSFCGNEWLVDDKLLQIVGESMPQLERLDLKRCKLVQGHGLQCFKATQLKYLTLDSCHPMASERLFTQTWRQNKTLTVGADAEDHTAQASHHVSFLFPQLEHLELAFCSNIDDKYLFLLSKCAKNLNYISLRGCVNITIRGVHKLCTQIPSLKRVDVSFCPQVDVQLLLETFMCKAQSPAYLIFGVEDWTPCGLCCFESTHPEHKGLTFVL